MEGYIICCRFCLFSCLFIKLLLWSGLTFPLISERLSGKKLPNLCPGKSTIKNNDAVFHSDSVVSFSKTLWCWLSYINLTRTLCNHGAGLSAVFCRQRNWGHTGSDVSKVTNESAAKPQLDSLGWERMSYPLSKAQLFNSILDSVISYLTKYLLLKNK